MAEPEELSEIYFKEYIFIIRAGFKELCGFIRNTAISRINLLLKKHVLEAAGTKRASKRVPTEKYRNYFILYY